MFFVVLVDIRQYWVRNLPDVTKQCSRNNLVASLLFKDVEFPENYCFARRITVSFAKEVDTAEGSPSTNKNEIVVHTTAVTQEAEKLTEKDELLSKIQAEKEKIADFQLEISSAVQQLEQVSTWCLFKKSFKLIFIQS